MRLYLEIAAEVLDEIRAHSREAYPFECCGALIGSPGSTGRVRRALRLPNTTEEGPRRRFLVRPDDYRSAEAAARSTDDELLGFYHSHPDHPAEPSAVDLAHAWPFFSYVIVSVRAGEPQDITSWRLRDDRSVFDPETVKISSLVR